MRQECAQVAGAAGTHTCHTTKLMCRRGMWLAALAGVPAGLCGPFPAARPHHLQLQAGARAGGPPGCAVGGCRRGAGWHEPRGRCWVGAGGRNQSVGGWEGPGAKLVYGWSAGLGELAGLLGDRVMAGWGGGVGGCSAARIDRAWGSVSGPHPGSCRTPGVNGHCSSGAWSLSRWH